MMRRRETIFQAIGTMLLKRSWLRKQGLKNWGEKAVSDKRGPTRRPAWITGKMAEYNSYGRQAGHHTLPLLGHHPLPPLVHHPLPPPPVHHPHPDFHSFVSVFTFHKIPPKKFKSRSTSTSSSFGKATPSPPTLLLHPNLTSILNIYLYF